VNHVKSLKGNGACSPCTGYFIANDEQKFCVDPYTETFLSLHIFTVKVCVILSSILALLAIIVMFLFVLYRKTPLVNAIDFKVSLFHVLVLLIQFLTPCYFFLGRPHVLRCTSLPLFICVLNTISISLVLVKSQKLLQAFQSKVKLDKTKARRTIIKQAGTVLLNILIACGVFVISLHAKQPGIRSIRLVETYEVILICNTNFHGRIQVALQIAFQIACFVPAYRGRNLPTVFSEAATIVYTSFTMTVAFLVFFPIQFFQKDLRDEQLVLWVALICTGFIQFTFIYTKKVFILLCQPKKNTRQYFRQETMDVFKMRATSLTSLKQAS